MIGELYISKFNNGDYLLRIANQESLYCSLYIYCNTKREFCKIARFNKNLVNDFWKILKIN